MAFTPKQREALQAKLRVRHVRTRLSQGAPIPYVEGWHVIAEANRIFGFDCWHRTTMSPRCVWRDTQRGQTVCLYTARVRITVDAGGTTIVRDGIGTGFGRSPAPEVAHEIAMKSAETDATKRALATFGNPFGLALYDKDRLQVTRSRRLSDEPRETGSSGDLVKTPIWVLVHADGTRTRFAGAEPFVAAVLERVPTLPTLEALYAFWEANLDGFRQLRATHDRDALRAIIGALKARARVLGRVAGGESSGNASDDHASALAVPKERRLRSKDHLAFVAKQPCLVCGRRPAHAHHLRFAQLRALALKVSDEFTVPLCAGHHDSVHQTGDEKAWWARQGIIDPLKFAARLWAASRLGQQSSDEPHLTSEGAPNMGPENLGPEMSSDA